ncbi:MAG: hypothetical protein HRT52_22095 [Colwellia sp.]|nr:hypothetical protein [Colwellia sp.]NQZ83701.1 hypothetical protein [Colwellia sp.]
MDYAIIDQLIPIIGGLYGIAFFGGYFEHSKKSPALVWARNKYPKSPKVMVYLCIFVIFTSTLDIIF